MQDIKSSFPGCSILSMQTLMDGFLCTASDDISSDEGYRFETCWWSLIAHDAGTDLHTDAHALSD